jgi:hypothetical protein
MNTRTAPHLLLLAAAALVFAAAASATSADAGPKNPVRNDLFLHR